MGRTAVIYCSEYGSTKRYAMYIGEQLQGDVFSTSQVKDISSYETIVYGGGIYGGSLNGSDWLIKNKEELKQKKLILFTCALADLHEEKNIENILKGLKQSLSEELVDHAKVFFLRGAFDYKSLKLTHKGMMTVLYQFIKRKRERSAEEEALLQTRHVPVDFVNLSDADPLISFAKG